MQPEIEVLAYEQTPATERTVFVIYTIADKVEKIGEVWYTHFLGSWESLAFGDERPFKDNARVKITFEEINDLPNQPPI